MDLVSLLLSGVGLPSSILLLNWWLNGGDAAGIPANLGEEVGKSLLKIAADKIKDILGQNKAKREFEVLGEKLATKLLPLFEESTKRGNCDAKKVIGELQFTLGTQPTPGLLVKKDLDPARIAAEMRARHQIDATTFTTAERELYEMALDQSVRHLVNLAAALPKFQVAVAKESLERLSRIGDDLDQVLETVQRIEQSVVKDSANVAARYEADYRQAVIRKLDYLELFGADIPPEARTHSLSVAYVSLNLQRAGAKDDETTSLPVVDVLDELRPAAGRLLIRGEAGSGKSTLFRWAAIQAGVGLDFHQPVKLRLDAPLEHVEVTYPVIATGRWDIGRPSFPAHAGPFKSASDERLDRHWRLRIPFLIRLRDFTDGSLPPPDKFPELIAKEIGSPPANWVLTVLQAGRAIVLLDGVDEIPGAKRDALKSEIKAIIDAFPQNYFLVSTRPLAVDEGWLAGEGFREATVNPMNDRDKAELIDKWHQAVGEELRRRGEHDPKLEGMAERLKGKLRETPAINLLAKYPLLAAMICAFHRRNNEHLPASEVELIERLCFMLLDDRDRLSGLRNDAVPDSYSKLEYRHKKLIVQDLAYHMLVHKGESSLAKSDAIDQVRERVARLGKSADPQVILTALIERSGMLREPVPGRIDFLHNSFKEYLTALRLVEENADGLLAGHWIEAAWLPVILFAAATEKRGFATSLIKKILTAGVIAKMLGPDPMAPVQTATRSTKPTEAEKQIRQRQVLALRCRTVALDVDPELQEKLNKQRAALFPPQTLTDAEALATVGDLAVDELKWRDDLTVKERAASARALRLIGTPQALAAMRRYINETDLAVIEELASVFNPLEIPAVQRMVQEPTTAATVTKQHNIRSQIVDLWPLAALTDLTSLNLRDTGVNDLSALTKLTGLTSLDLGGTQVSDLSPLAGLTNLTSLDLGSTQVSDLSPLTGLKSLTSLQLSRTPLKDFSPLAGLTALTSLDLLGTQGRDLTPLAGLTSLTSLNLGFTRVRNLSPLTRLTGLTWIDLGGTQVFDLSALAGLTSLKEIWLWKNQDVSTPVSLQTAIRRPC